MWNIDHRNDNQFWQAASLLLNLDEIIDMENIKIQILSDVYFVVGSDDSNNLTVQLCMLNAQVQNFVVFCCY